MRKLLFTLALTATTATFAQDQSSITYRAQLRTEQMTAQLHLDRDQAARVLVIHQRYLGILDQLDHIKATPSVNERKAMVNADYEKALLRVLDPEQIHGLKAQWMDETPTDSTGIGQ